MGRNKTLNDLSDFLNDNPQQINFKSPSSKAEYLKSEPNSLVDVPQIKEHQPKADWSALSPSEIANALHLQAKENKKSFVDLWLKILEEGAKKDPLLKNTNGFKVLKSIRNTSINIALEGISQLIKKKE